MRRRPFRANGAERIRQCVVLRLCGGALPGHAGQRLVCRLRGWFVPERCRDGQLCRVSSGSAPGPGGADNVQGHSLCGRPLRPACTASSCRVHRVRHWAVPGSASADLVQDVPRRLVSGRGRAAVLQRHCLYRWPVLAKARWQRATVRGMPRGQVRGCGRSDELHALCPRPVPTADCADLVSRPNVPRWPARGCWRYNGQQRCLRPL